MAVEVEVSRLVSYNYPDYQDHPPNFPSKYASAWGKDQYGIWFEISVEKVIQRFRWIPKGTFTMGSPESEKERRSNEILHEVTLTQGFWLADTACTQELWQAVMGHNPSHFSDNLQNPVEQVSWINIQVFLANLNQAIPYLKAHLPTEAQWEYACRAGTITPFALGENITTDLVNYNGGRPYVNGVKGKYREKTVPVKTLVANQWGLYQMHGNVWEWCLDEYHSDLGTEPMQNPFNASFKSGFKPDNISIKTGFSIENASTMLTNTNVYDSTMLANTGDGNVERVLRGGSWTNFGRICRSAFRRWYEASYHDGRNGFRIALGH